MYSADAPHRKIATVAKTTLSAEGDAAFAAFDETCSWVPAMKSTNINLAGARDPQIGETLCKYGHGSGLTRARVDGIGFYKICYQTGPNETHIVEIKGFRLTPEKTENAVPRAISLPGDNGAGWVHPITGEMIGLHTTGEGSPFPNEDYAIACNMTSVLEKLGLKLATFKDLATRGFVQPNPAQETLQNIADRTPLRPKASPAWLDDPRGYPYSCDTDFYHQDVPFGLQPPIKRIPPKSPLLTFEGDALYGSISELATTMSITGNIWDMVLVTLRKKYPNLKTEPIRIDDPLDKYLNKDAKPASLLKILSQSPKLLRDDATPTLSSLIGKKDFRDVCVEIGDVYRALGYPVAA